MRAGVSATLQPVQEEKAGASATVANPREQPHVFCVNDTPDHNKENPMNGTLGAVQLGGPGCVL